MLNRFIVIPRAIHPATVSTCTHKQWCKTHTHTRRRPFRFLAKATGKIDDVISRSRLGRGRTCGGVSRLAPVPLAQNTHPGGKLPLFAFPPPPAPLTGSACLCRSRGKTTCVCVGGLRKILFFFPSRKDKITFCIRHRVGVDYDNL